MGVGFGLRPFFASCGQMTYAPSGILTAGNTHNLEWRNDMRKNKPDTQKREKLSLLWHFLKGSKRYFLAAILSAGVTALADMLQPQIIRAAVDNAIGGKAADFPPFVMALVEKVGGFRYLGQHLWIMALAILVVALFQVASQYSFRVYNTVASETLVKTMRDQLFSHIARLPFSWHMKNRTGDIIQRCTSDIDTTKNFLSELFTRGSVISSSSVNMQRTYTVSPLASMSRSNIIPPSASSP